MKAGVKQRRKISNQLESYGVDKSYRNVPEVEEELNGGRRRHSSRFAKYRSALSLLLTG